MTLTKALHTETDNDPVKRWRCVLCQDYEPVQRRYSRSSWTWSLILKYLMISPEMMFVMFGMNYFQE